MSSTSFSLILGHSQLMAIIFGMGNDAWFAQNEIQFQTLLRLCPETLHGSSTGDPANLSGDR